MPLSLPGRKPPLFGGIFSWGYNPGSKAAAAVGYSVVVMCVCVGGCGEVRVMTSFAALDIGL